MWSTFHQLKIESRASPLMKPLNLRHPAVFGFVSDRFDAQIGSGGGRCCSCSRLQCHRWRKICHGSLTRDWKLESTATSSVIIPDFTRASLWPPFRGKCRVKCSFLDCSEWTLSFQSTQQCKLFTKRLGWSLEFHATSQTENYTSFSVCISSWSKDIPSLSTAD